MKKLAVINDISGLGRCSMVASISVCSALKVQCCPLVTGVFSAQTGFDSFVHSDLTSFLPHAAGHWQTLGEKFDGVLTGFISSGKQGKEIYEIACKLSEGGKLFVDPVMGDYGKIYPCCDEDTIFLVKKLVEKADVIMPNMTELALLAEQSFISEGSYKDTVLKVLQYSKQISESKLIITTGVPCKENKIATVISCGGTFFSVESQKFGGSFSGTGDLFASIVSAMLIKGSDVKTAVEKATKFISLAAKRTVEENPHYDRNEGVMFEYILEELI